MAQAKEVRGPGPRMGGPRPKVENPGKLLKRIMDEVFRHYLPHCILVLVCIVVSALANVQASLFLQTLIDDYIIPMTQQQDPSFAPLAGALVRVGCIYVVGILAAWLNARIMVNVTQGTLRNLRTQLFTHMESLPIKYFDQHPHGDIMSVYTNDVDTLQQGLNQSITQLVTSVTTIIGVMVMMLSISPLMTLIAVLILPVSMVLVLFVVKISQKYFKSQQEYLGHINGQVEEIYSGHNIVKAFNREERVIEDFNEANDILYKSAWKSQFFSGVMMPVMTFVGNLGYVAVAVVGGLLAANGTIMVGDILSFIQYVKSFTQPITQLAQVSSMLQSTAAAAERVFEFLAEDEEEQCAKEHAMLTDTSGNTRNVTTLDITGDVTFEHVRFGYTPEKIIINDFSARVRQGQKIAIVGPTGAGKTTIVKLLMRFYELNGGRILIDGYDIADFDRSELRELFGMVLQDTWLFKGSIMENIRYGKLDATDDEVIAAAKAAHVDHFIRTLPGGYDMELNEEASNVSQGQKQLLTIARAILANNKILILDEATSSVDTRTEIQIQKAMDNLMKGRTSFVIAHRLSTIKDADLILVLKDGDIIEQGNHEKLIAKNGFYAELYNSQFDS